MPNNEHNLNQKAIPQLIDLEKEIAELKKIIQRGKPVELYSNQTPVLPVTADAPFEPILDRTQILEEQRKDKNIQKIILNLTACSGRLHRRLNLTPLVFPLLTR